MQYLKYDISYVSGTLQVIRIGYCFILVVHIPTSETVTSTWIIFCLSEVGEERDG